MRDYRRRGGALRILRIREDWSEPDKSSGEDQTKLPTVQPISGNCINSLDKYAAPPPRLAVLRLLNQAAMPGRRSDARYTLTKPTYGTLQVFRDVMVYRNGEQEWIALSREAAVCGETMVLDLVIVDINETRLWDRLTVCVIESRPVIVDGDMRYRIRLHGEDPPMLFEQQIRRG